jgi:hypothetical protein
MFQMRQSAVEFLKPAEMAKLPALKGIAQGTVRAINSSGSPELPYPAGFPLPPRGSARLKTALLSQAPIR